ncbi:unnamed protein product, partial [Hapterophycus canaliculatus]
MGKKQGCYEPRCHLLMVSSALLFPLKGSTAFQHVALGRRCTHQQHRQLQQQLQQRRAAMAGSWTPLSSGVPLLRGVPVKSSQRDHDAVGGKDESTTEDDSSSGSTAVDETLAFLRQPAPAPATPKPTASTTVGEDDAAMLVDGKYGAGAADAADAFAEAACNLEEEVASFEFAPPMTVRKFMTMQDRRVPVLIKYSGGGGFKRYFEEIAKVLKRHFPDVIIDREIVEVSSTREEEVFEIRIDGKL